MDFYDRIKIKKTYEIDTNKLWLNFLRNFKLLFQTIICTNHLLKLTTENLVNAGHSKTAANLMINMKPRSYKIIKFIFLGNKLERLL